VALKIGEANIAIGSSHAAVGGVSQRGILRRWDSRVAKMARPSDITFPTTLLPSIKRKN